MRNNRLIITHEQSKMRNPENVKLTDSMHCTSILGAKKTLSKRINILHAFFIDMDGKRHRIR